MICVVELAQELGEFAGGDHAVNQRI